MPALISCPVCGWTPPLMPGSGLPVWGPISLSSGMGGPGRGLVAQPGVTSEFAVFPTRSGAIHAVRFLTGETVFHLDLPEKRTTRQALPVPQGFLFPVSDERFLGQAESGYLALLNTKTGELETAWYANAPALSPLAASPSYLCIRTSAPELVLFQNKSPFDVVWRKPMHTWWALPPLLAGDLIIVPDGDVMQQTGQLEAYSLAGVKVWESFPLGGLPAQELDGDPISVVFSFGDGKLVCIETATGKLTWQNTFARIYSPPVLTNNLVYLVCRVEKSQQGVYQLIALHRENGVTAWVVNLPHRARLRPTINKGVVFVGTESGEILAFRADDGLALWQYTLGLDNDPIHTELNSHSNVLVAGTYNGVVAGLQAFPDAPEPAHTESYLEFGDYEQAAVAYVIAGDLDSAGKIFLEKLNQPGKAIQIFAHGGEFFQAGQVAETLGENSQALAFYEKAHNISAQVALYLKMGDKLTAARLLESIQQFQQAAELYEDLGEKRKALELYQQAQFATGVSRLSGEVTLKLTDIEFLEQVGRYKAAGKAAQRAGMLRKAIDMFEKGGELELELQALQLFLQETPNPWGYERFAQVANRLGQFEEEAEARLSLNQPGESAAAYERAAEMWTANQPQQEEKVGILYQKAMQQYEKAGLDTEMQRCEKAVIAYLKLPVVELEVIIDGVFQESSFNKVKYLIHNTGKSTAYSVGVYLGADRFEVEESTGSVLYPSLGPGVTRQAESYLRPKKGEVGGAVPFTLEWTWQDDRRNTYTRRVRKDVTVKAQESSATPIVPPSGQPVVQQHRILFLAANPNDYNRLLLTNEIKNIDRAIHGAEFRELFDVEQQWDVQVTELQSFLLRYRPEIVHFSGYGSQENELILLDANGQSKPVPVLALKNLFKVLKSNIRLVVLNACFSKEQALAIAEHIDCVVGMEDKLEERLAANFSFAFYQALAYGENVQTAFELGKNQLEMTGSLSSHVVQLISNVDPAQVRFIT